MGSKNECCWSRILQNQRKAKIEGKLSIRKIRATLPIARYKRNMKNFTINHLTLLRRPANGKEGK